MNNTGDALFQKIAHPFHRRLRIVGMLPRLQFEITLLAAGIPLANQHTARLKAFQPLQRRLSRRSRRTKAEQLTQAVPIQNRIQNCASKQRVRVIGKNQSAPCPSKKDFSLPHAIPAHDHPVSRNIGDAAHAGALDVTGIIITPCSVGAERQLRLGGVGRASQFPGQSAAIAHAPLHQRHASCVRSRFKTCQRHLTLRNVRRIADTKRARTNIPVICTQKIHGSTPTCSVSCYVPMRLRMHIPVELLQKNML